MLTIALIKTLKARETMHFKTICDITALQKLNKIESNNECYDFGEVGKNHMLKLQNKSDISKHRSNISQEPKMNNYLDIGQVSSVVMSGAMLEVSKYFEKRNISLLR